MNSLKWVKWLVVYWSALSAVVLFSLPFAAGGGWFFLMWLGVPIPLAVAILLAIDQDA